MSASASRVVYRPPDATHEIEVRRLLPSDMSPDLGFAIGELLAAAWSAQFELPRRALPTGHIRHALFGETLASRRQAAEMQALRAQEFMTHFRSRYWVVSDAAGQLLSLAKISPQPDRLYVNDVLTLPSQQGQGLGSCTLHAALSSFCVNGNTPVTLDAFIGNEVNDWFHRLGFEYLEDIPEPYSITYEYAMWQQRFGNVTRDTVLQNLAVRTGEPLSAMPVV